MCGPSPRSRRPRASSLDTSPPRRPASAQGRQQDDARPAINPSNQTRPASSYTPFGQNQPRSVRRIHFIFTGARGARRRLVWRRISRLESFLAGENATKRSNVVKPTFAAETPLNNLG